MKNKHLSSLVTKELYCKSRYVAEKGNRTLSGLIRYLLIKYIREYENKNGNIALPENFECEEKV